MKQTPQSAEKIATAINALATSAGWQAHYNSLLAAGRAIVPQLIEGATHSETSVRLWSVDLLGKAGDPRGDEAIFAAMKDPVADVRRHAVLALVAIGKRGEASAAQLLATCLEKDRSLLVRRLAAHVIADLPPDANVAATLRRVMLREKDTKLRNAVWRAIGRHEEMTEPLT
ncbi:MAG: HEAT repeat domain-containing protein [Tepidisphaeraceae bacterium]